jgi:GT2 family glycosyltransferase
MISIIIIVKNDRGISNTLDALKKINIPIKTEILVIDASEDALDDIKKNFSKVKWVSYHNKDKRVTIPEQRNLGIKTAKGDVVVFIDANCVPVKNWLTELYKYYVKYGENIVAGEAKPFDKNIVNTITNEKLKKKYLVEAPTINILFNKSVFKKIGYFDETGTYGEDIDLTWRAVEAGYKIRYAKKAIVYHDWGDFKEQTSRMVRYGFVRPRLYRKHTNKIKEVLVGNNITAIIYPLFIICLPIAIIFPYYLLLLLVPIIKNMNHRPIMTTYLNLAYGVGVIKGTYVEFIKNKFKSL